MELIVDIKKKLSDFTLNINFKCTSSILGLLGQSGSGKSMTLRCIAGLEKPDEGKIVLNGRTLFDSENNINLPIKDRRIGFLFQNYALFPHMTVERNIEYAISHYTKSERTSIVNEMLSRMHIEDLRKRYPHEISGGQQQRTALARALAVKPEALLLDEPFSALDNHLKGIMLEQMKVILEDYSGAALFITHNIEEAYQLCEELVIIDKGEQAAEGNKRDIFNRPSSLAAARITGCKNITSCKINSYGLLDVPDWNCSIEVSKIMDSNIRYIGIRERHLKLAEGEDKNCFNCWPVLESETPFSMLVYLSINRKPSSHNDYNLIWELTYEQWNKIKNMPLPWKVHLDEEKLIFIR